MDDGGGDRFGSSRFSQHWRLAGYGRRSFSSGSDGRSLSGRTGSDGPSWWKDEGRKEIQNEKRGEEAEVQSPLKEKQREDHEAKSKKVRL